MHAKRDLVRKRVDGLIAVDRLGGNLSFDQHLRGDGEFVEYFRLGHWNIVRAQDQFDLGNELLQFLWKDGVAMRPVESSKRTDASVRRLAPYSSQAAAELAPRFEWTYSFTIQSAGVPLTNDLVFLIENEDHKIAARTAARL